MQSDAAVSRFHVLAGNPHVEAHLLPLKSNYSESTLIKIGMLNKCFKQQITTFLWPVCSTNNLEGLGSSYP